LRRRKRCDDSFKAKIALEAIKDKKTLAELASECGVHPDQITRWKKRLLENEADIFSRNIRSTRIFSGR